MTDALSIARDLIRCPSVTPADAGALGVLEKALNAAGFTCHRVTFSEAGTADVDNLYARIGTEGPHITFAGHTDVVPPGDENAWSVGAFSGEVKDGFLHGRGAVDMKGGIACSVAAVLEHLAANGGAPRADGKGSISFLITGDEEDVSVNGTIKLLKWAAERGEKFDHCVLGEPSNVETLGDTIKVGRRGSQSGTLFVDGVQGHVAYPHRAANPVPDISRLIVAISDEPLDHGSAQFQASNLEFTSVDVGNKANNVIPGEARAKFNIRYNDNHTQASLRELVETRLTKACGNRIKARIVWESLELECVRDQARPVHRSCGVGDRRGDGAQAGTIDLRRHLGRALHLELLPGDRVRPGRPDHAPSRRARAGGGSGEADAGVSGDFGAVFWVGR
ncbi:succinyl-diaminopimelate desuccinylase [Bradyrhizobium sp. i1.4.4]